MLHPARRTGLIRRAAPLLALALLLPLAPSARAAAPTVAGPAGKAMDALLSKSFPANEPGAAVIVVKDGQVVLRKGYGLAHLELGVPVSPEMRFRIGSVTKQFTAAAILLLAEDGKLAVEDPITRFLPGYPTHGKTITIEHLLTHTSGIKSYTDMPEWLRKWRQDMPLDTLIALFKDQPMDFEPGEKWAYDNSGYVLLGAIVERASGRPYADFVRDRIFAPLGMTHTTYDTTASILPGRVSGYSKSSAGWANAAYLSMTQPYAAGALVSTVDDMARWNAALDAEKLLQQPSLRRAWTPYRLRDGSSTGYGYGWMMGALQERPTVEHGGGINGFVCATLRLPDDHVYVALLTNREADQPSPDRLAALLAAIAIGKPYTEPKPVALTAAQMDAVAGVYRIGDKERRVITHDAARVYSQRSGGPKRELIALAPLEFGLDNSFTRFSFELDASGRARSITTHARYGPAEVAPRTDEPLPVERTAVRLAPEALERCVGRYELAPGFVLAVSRDGERLWMQATGQDKAEIFPESETHFFLKVVDAQIDFEQDAAGALTTLVLHQGGMDMKAKRVQ